MYAAQRGPLLTKEAPGRQELRTLLICSANSASVRIPCSFNATSSLS